MKLSDAALEAGSADERADGVALPRYDRSAVTASVVHFGVGGFHRAHQAMYLDGLLAEGELRWGICGVGVLESDRAMRDALQAQDHLYTLVQKHSDGTYEARVIGSMVDYLYAPEDPEAVIARLADPATEIVSLTITEGGYAISDVTGHFDPQAPGGRGRPAARARRRRASSGSSSRGWPDAGRRAPGRSRSSPATTCPATAHSLGRRSSLSRASSTPTSAHGSTPRCASRTRWSTGSPRRPPTKTAMRSKRDSGSRTAGRSSASRSSNGCSRTPSAATGRRSRESGSRSSPTSHPTS